MRQNFSLPASALALTLTLFVIPAAPGAEPEAAVEAAQADRAPTLESLEAAVQAQPGDGEAWLALGRRYIDLDRAEDAAKALREASTLRPDDAAVRASLAEALALLSGSLQGEPLRNLYQALDLDGNNVKALELLGLHHFREGNYRQAAYYWRRITTLVAEDSTYGRDMATAYAEARRLAHAADNAPASGAAAPTSPHP